MATVNLACVICTECYKNTDSVVSTTCGHVFHSNCLQEWRMRSAVCPECRATVTMTPRIYLNFEENNAERDKQFVELRSKVEQHIKQNSILQQQLDESERDFLKLQEQFSKKDNESRELYKQIEYLTLQNETRVNEIELKTIEIHKLQEALNSTNPQASTVMLQEEIKILKEKNKQITNELNKEIRNSTQLSVEKMKLENMLEYAKSMPSSSTAPSAAPLLQPKLPSSSSARPQSSKSDSNREQRRPRPNKEADGESWTKRPGSSQSGRFEKNRGCIQSVVIRNVQGAFSDENELKSFVLKLSDLMDLFYSGDDLEHVTVMERKQHDTMSLIAKFKNIGLRAQFLSRKDRLKTFEQTNKLLLLEYVGDNTNSLFHYAKTLKPLGFKHVYCRNNQVFVRKGDGSIPMRIKNHAEVDKLKSDTVSESAMDGASQPSAVNVGSSINNLLAACGL